MKSKIYEDSPGYSILRRIVDRYIHGSYKRYRVHGLENIPKDGQVIFSPNHCNALMDPFAVLSMTPEKKVFVARADVFKKPIFKKILTFFKIMPINRQRDGLRTVLNVEATIEKSIEVLNNNVKFCILPEGTHRSMHSLLPIGKGIARIAVGAHKTAKKNGHVYIVPVGCEYGDYYRFRSTQLLQVGKAIDISEHIDSHQDKTEYEIMGDIRKMTEEGMKDLIVWIPDDENYEGTWELAKMMSGSVREGAMEKRFAANKKAVEKILAFKESHPEKAAALFEKAIDFARARKKAKVSIYATFGKKPILSALRYTLMTLVNLPCFLALAAASLPSWVVGETLAGKVKDRTFRNSLRCGAIIVLWSLLMIAWIIVLFCTVPWYWALLGTIVLTQAPFVTYDYFENVRRAASSWRYLFNHSLKAKKNELLKEIETL